jgi:hypothetical protein
MTRRTRHGAGAFTPNPRSGSRRFIHSVLNGSQRAYPGKPWWIVIDHRIQRQIAMAGPQLAGYFMRLALKANEQIFRGWRQPALGLLIGGEGKCTSWQRSLICASLVSSSHAFISMQRRRIAVQSTVALYAAFHTSRDPLTRVENDVLIDANELLMGEIAKKRGKKRPAQSTHRRNA